MSQRSRVAREHSQKYGPRMEEVPREEWPQTPATFRANPLRVWRSRHLIATLYDEGTGAQRLSVMRASVGVNDSFREGITWDDLHLVKKECGFDGEWAVECYPPTYDLVNVANMRHLWILQGPPSYGWHKDWPRGEFNKE